MRSSRFTTQLLITLLTQLIYCSVGGKTCDAEGFCSSESSLQCGLPNAMCHSGCQTSIYCHGGNAQAYKANAPTKTSVCDADVYSGAKAKVASWSYGRSSKLAPKISIVPTFWSCSTSEKEGCCCEPLKSPGYDLTQGTLEVWQTRPNGTYSSLRQGEQEGDCRARMSMAQAHVIETVAPGSTGILGGLGPAGWDFMPYGPPVIHMLATLEGHAPTLVDVPVAIDSRTMESKAFRGPDWRGAAWVSESYGSAGFTVASWKADAAKNEVVVEVDIHMLAVDKEAAPMSSAFCPSLIYGLPSAFFLEPITECAPSMLDFFEL